MAVPTLVIPRITSELPQSTPNLMPFHIKYTGPADVSTFMRVERYQPLLNVASSREETSKLESAAGEAEACTGEDVEMKTETETDLPTTGVVVTETQPDDVEMQTEGGTSESQSTLVASASISTLAGSQQDSQSSLLLHLEPQASSSSFVGDTSKRFVSSFRGRTIHGIEVSLPEGYTGLVLKSSDDTTQSASAKGEDDKERSSKPGRATRLTAKNKGKAKVETVDNEDGGDEVEDEKPKPRTRGRLARSAVPTKEVVTIHSDSEPEDQTVESAPTAAPDTPLEDKNLIKNLTPISQFTSFTLWHPDRPVDTSRDEYFRSLNEWIGLAREIHRTDLDVTA